MFSPQIKRTKLYQEITAECPLWMQCGEENSSRLLKPDWADGRNRKKLEREKLKRAGTNQTKQRNRNSDYSMTEKGASKGSFYWGGIAG